MAPTHNTTRLDLVVEPINNIAQKFDAAALRVLALEPLASAARVGLLRVDAEPELLQFRDAPHSGLPSSRDLAFEPLTIDGRASLLMQCPPGLCVRVNGSPAGRLTVVSEGEQVQLLHAVLHAVKFIDFHTGPPLDQHIGRVCGVCRTPIDKKTRVYLHECGAIYHIEDESTPAGERLECALVAGTCSTCERTISMQSGYRELPDL